MFSNPDASSGRSVAWDRPLRPRRVGVVFGGGAARGIAHIGALQMLEESNIFPKIVVGTSVGALVGGLYAAGISPTRMVGLLGNLNWLDLISLKLPSLNWSDLARSIPFGLGELDKLAAWVDQAIGAPVQIQQLNLPFAAVATDIVTGEVVVMNEGPLAEAIWASCSVPGVFAPYRRNGRLLVDGVVVNNLPVSIAHDLGADYVIGVDLLPVGGNSQVEPRNVVEVAMTALFMLARATQIENQLADVVVTPAIGHVNLADLTKGTELIAAGRSAMQAALPQIKSDLGLTD